MGETRGSTGLFCEPIGMVADSSGTDTARPEAAVAVAVDPPAGEERSEVPFRRPLVTRRAHQTATTLAPTAQVRTAPGRLRTDALTFSMNPPCVGRCPASATSPAVRKSRAMDRSSSASDRRLSAALAICSLVCSASCSRAFRADTCLPPGAFPCHLRRFFLAIASTPPATFARLHQYPVFDSPVGEHGV